jgi:hypothetical protein
MNVASGRTGSLLSGAVLALVAALVCGGLVWVGLARPGASTADPGLHAVLETLKLVYAALIGAVVSAVHRRYPGDKPLTRSLAQAQILLCVAGALMMIIIGDSLARAFGIAGGAAIVRFRTPVEDPKDTTVLFLLLGLGMACGLGAIAIAGLGMAFLCVCLVVLDLVLEPRPRAMILEMVASGPQFPTDYVNQLLSAYRIRFEPREVGTGQKASVRYHCTLHPDTPLQRLSEQLMDTEAAGLKSVSWESPKRE